MKFSEKNHEEGIDFYSNSTIYVEKTESAKTTELTNSQQKNLLQPAGHHATTEISGR